MLSKEAQIAGCGKPQENVSHLCTYPGVWWGEGGTHFSGPMRGVKEVLSLGAYVCSRGRYGRILQLVL